MKYQLRFLLTYIIVIASIFSFYTSINNEHKKRLHLSENELHGVIYLKNLYQLSINTIIYHKDLSIKNSKETDKAKQKFLHSISKVFTLQKKYPLFSDANFNKKLILLQANNASEKNYADFLEYINHENYRVGDISKLLFEEERKLHFLASMLTHYMPEYLISVLISHNIANVFEHKGTLSIKEKSLYVEQSKLMFLSSQELSTIIAFLNSYKDTKKLTILMNQILQELNVLQKERVSFLKWEHDPQNLQAYLKSSQKILQLSYKLNNEHIHILELNLQNRISLLHQEISRNKFLFIFLTLFLSVILFYFYKTFTANIKKDAELKKINATLDTLVIFSKADTQGNITYVSSALEKLSGYTRRELLGTTHQLCKGDTRVFNDIKYTIASKQTWLGELKNKHKNGTDYWIKATISPELDENDLVIGFHVYMEDINNQKKLQEEKLKTQSALEFRSKFLSNMSHEIRTPLNGITNLIDITTKTALSKEQTELMSKMKSASQMLLSLVNDILDLSKIESGKMTTEKIPFELKSCVENIINILAIEAQIKHITLKHNYKNISDSQYLGDSLRISQILTNLLNNAIKFTSKGSVTLNIYTNNKGFVQFDIIDTGIGVKQENINSLFSDFMQADMSTSRKYGGTGLGLSISKSLVELMGGNIWVESSFGKGSTFSFELPLKTAPIFNNKLSNVCYTNEDKDEKEIKHFIDSLENINILVAEDNTMNQTVLELLLGESKLKLDFANDGEIAVEKFNHNHYEIILMDIQMPNMNGYEATKIIRAKDKAIPIIALSANIIQKDVQEAMQIGMNNFLPKPIEVDKLYGTLYKYLKHTSS